MVSMQDALKSSNIFIQISLKFVDNGPIDNQLIITVFYHTSLFRHF